MLAVTCCQRQSVYAPGRHPPAHQPPLCPVTVFQMSFRAPRTGLGDRQWEQAWGWRAGGAWQEQSLPVGVLETQEMCGGTAAPRDSYKGEFYVIRISSHQKKGEKSLRSLFSLYKPPCMTRSTFPGGRGGGESKAGPCPAGAQGPRQQARFEWLRSITRRPAPRAAAPLLPALPEPQTEPRTHCSLDKDVPLQNLGAGIKIKKPT